MKKYITLLGKLAALSVFALAVWLLYGELRIYSLMEIRRGISLISPCRLSLSLLLMALNYIVLIGYDWLALKAIHKTLGMGRVCMVSFVGCVISSNFGALLGGSTVRYRLYSAWGFSPLDIIRLVIMLAITFWVGAMGLAGFIFLCAPPAIPPELPVDPAFIRPFGALLLLLCLLYLALCAASKGRPFLLFGKAFALPPLPIAAAQTLVAGLDLIVAAACLYALMPPDSGVGFLEFLPNYLLAQVAAILTHVPGGMGVLEVIVMNLTGEIPAQRVFAGILVFRVVYYLLPLMLAALLLGVYELYLRRHETDALVQDASRWLRAWMPSLMSYAVFLGGTVLCLSVAVPMSPRQMLFLKPYIPLWMLECSHMLTGLVGILSLVLAHGLQKRRRMAWKLSLAALSAGIFSNLCKGVDWPEALLLLAVLFPLALSKRSFGRIASLGRESYPLQWIGAIAVVVISCTALGLYFAGLPTDSDVFLYSAYSAMGPRILRTLALQLIFLWLLLALHIRARIVAGRQ